MYSEEIISMKSLVKEGIAIGEFLIIKEHVTEKEYRLFIQG